MLPLIYPHHILPHLPRIPCLVFRQIPFGFLLLREVDAVQGMVGIGLGDADQGGQQRRQAHHLLHALDECDLPILDRIRRSIHFIEHVLQDEEENLKFFCELNFFLEYFFFRVGEIVLNGRCRFSRLHLRIVHYQPLVVFLFE
jgi:hypothetical protein